MKNSGAPSSNFPLWKRGSEGDLICHIGMVVAESATTTFSLSLRLRLKGFYPIRQHNR